MAWAQYIKFPPDGSLQTAGEESIVGLKWTDKEGI